MTGRPSVPEAPKLKMPDDGAKEKKAAQLEARRKRASTILTKHLDDPETTAKSILGG